MRRGLLNRLNRHLRFGSVICCLAGPLPGFGASETVTSTGQIARIQPGTFGPCGPSDLTVGTPFTVTVNYDTTTPRSNFYSEPNGFTAATFDGGTLTLSLGAYTFSGTLHSYIESFPSNSNPFSGFNFHSSVTTSFPNQPPSCGPTLSIQFYLVTLSAFFSTDVLPTTFPPSRRLYPATRGFSLSSGWNR